MRIDLHTHSTASDGTDSPAELVATARAARLDVVAITDHDTTGGWEEAVASLPTGLTLVTGCEFSCVYTTESGHRIGLHLLGYLFDPEHEGLRAERARLRASRRGRARQIVENMVADGVPISWDQVIGYAGDGAIGRPHIGRALVAAGVVPDVTTAFGTYLSSRAKFYVRKVDVDVFDALALVRAAGGTTVFAHPLARARGPVVGDEVIARMASAGLTGLEVDHVDHTPADRAHAAGLAAELGLVVTGSSDYHGTNKTTAIGARLTSPAQYEALLARPAARSPIAP